MLLPQQRATPPASSTHALIVPATTVTEPGTLTSLGTSDFMFAPPPSPSWPSESSPQHCVPELPTPQLTLPCALTLVHACAVTIWGDPRGFVSLLPSCP